MQTVTQSSHPAMTLPTVLAPYSPVVISLKTSKVKVNSRRYQWHFYNYCDGSVRLRQLRACKQVI